MTPPPEPHPILTRLLRAVSSRDAAGAAIGDICHEFTARRAAGSAPAWPGFWVNLRVARIILALWAASIPRGLRSANLVRRDAFRTLRRSPAHAAFVVGVLALAMAAGTVTFSVVDAVVLKPLPIAEPDRVVFVPQIDPDNRSIRVTPDVFWRLHDHPSSLESVTYVSLSATNSTQRITIGPATDVFRTGVTIADTFEVFRMRPVVGRFWTTEDEARGESDVAVISYRIWQDVFNGSPSALGAPVAWAGRSLRVIGVASPDTWDPNIPILAPDLWVPRANPREDKTSFVAPIGRMRPGATMDDVAVDVQRALGTNEWRPEVMRLADVYTSRVSDWMLLALGAAGIVVLIACVNAANLLLTRSVERLRETGVRSALGASRRRVAAGAVCEGMTLAGAAAALALLVGYWGIQTARVTLAALPLGLFRVDAIALNGRVFAAAIAAALVTGLLVTIVPAWQASRASVVTLLKDHAPTAAGGRGRWRTAFLVSEVAAVSVLLVVSWLFVASLVNSVNVDIGVDRDHLIGINASMPFRVPVDDVRARLEQLPGVTGVAMSRGASPPIFGRISGAWITNAFAPAGTQQAPTELLDHRVSRNFFSVMGIRVTRGSVWAEAVENEPFASAPVLLDEQAAARLFGVEDPIGRQVVTSEPTGVHTVIGLVPHVLGNGPEEESQPAAYFPLKPDSARTFASLLVSTSRSPDVLVPMITNELRSFNESSHVYSANEALRMITTTRRFTAALMSLFGLIGGLIGAAGIYAVMSAVVVQKTREIGVRVALGATAGDVQRGIVRLAGRHIAAGLAVGLPLGWWLSRGFATLLFQVTPADGAVYAGVAVLLGLVGGMAALIPARRAARVDPNHALRH
jgi:predicted permease